MGGWVGGVWSACGPYGRCGLRLSFTDEKLCKSGCWFTRVVWHTALRVRCARCSSGARACDVAARGCASGRAWIDRGGSSLVCREVNGRARSVIRAELDRHARLPSRSPPRPSGRKAGGPGRTARFGREKTRVCDRAVGEGDAHLEESGRDGRASVGLVRERLPGARDHRVRVVIPVEPRLVPGDVIADESGQRGVSQRKCEHRVRAVKDGEVGAAMTRPDRARTDAATRRNAVKGR